MYKNIKKLAAFILVSILLSMMNISFLAYADAHADTYEDAAADDAAYAKAAEAAEAAGGAAATGPGASVTGSAGKVAESMVTADSIDSGLAHALDGLKECIPVPKTKAARYQYIHTILEEPLDYTQLTDAEMDAAFGKDLFISTICYRSTFAYHLSDIEGQIGEEIVLPKLATSCSEIAAALEVEHKKTTTENNIVVTYSCKQVQVLLSRGGTSLLEGYISQIYKFGASIVGIIAVLVMVISGIQISASGGDTEAVNEAKTRIIKSISGIALLFLSGLILYTINPNFFV